MKARWPAPFGKPPRRSALSEPEVQMFLFPTRSSFRPRTNALRRFPRAAPGLGWSPEVDLWLDATDADDAPPPEAG